MATGAATSRRERLAAARAAGARATALRDDVDMLGLDDEAVLASILQHRAQRTGPTTVHWTSPQGRTYTVDHTGTVAH